MGQNNDLGHLVVSQHFLCTFGRECLSPIAIFVYDVIYDVRNLKYLNIVCNNLHVLLKSISNRQRYSTQDFPPKPY